MAENKKKKEVIEEVEEIDVDEDYLTLKIGDDDNAEEIECRILGVFEVGKNEYIALLPEGSDEDIYIYGYEEYEDDTFELIYIEDDEEFERVSAELEKYEL